MKKFFNIFLLCLMTTTAVAQTTATHRLRVKTIPEMFFITMQVYETAQTNSSGNFTGTTVLALRSDTADIDVQVAAGAGIQLRIDVPNGSDDNINNYTATGWKGNGAPTQVAQHQYVKNTFLWVMPDHDVELVGTFEYTPANPDEYEQPAMGSWDPQTGTLIIDGSRDSRYPIGFNYNDDRSKVLRYIRAGSYWEDKNVSFSASNFPNCIFWDASRTNAASASCSFNNDSYTAVTEAVLPATITKLDADAFRHTRLQVLTLFAMTPPENGASVRNYQTNQYEWHTAFPDCPDMTVRVPAEAVSLFQADEHWKDYNIVAMADDYVNLTVRLMEEADAATIAKYRNMSLVLTNKASGVKRRFVLTDRNEYEFRYLTTNTTYSVVLLNSYDDEVASIGNIYLAEESKSVTMPALRGVHNLQLTLTVDGQPLGEAMYAVTWLDGDGSFVARGPRLSGVLDGDRLHYTLQMDQSLAMQYMVPEDADITVGQQPDAIVLPLQPIEEREVAFLVVDSLTNQGIAGATITVAQLFSRGERGTTVTLTTGADGRASGSMLAVTSAVTVNSPMHGSQSFAVNLAEAGGNSQSPIRVAFLQASGTTIQLSHTFQAAVADGQQPTVKSGYDDGRNLEYTFTVTLPDGRDSLINRYLVNYPLFTLYSDLPKGTKVKVQATSANGAIEPVAAEATMGEGKTVQVTLPIVERGYIVVSYSRTESGKPAVLVFNAAGELVRRLPFYDTDGKTMTVTSLPTGSYMVAAMSQGVQYASISNRRQLEMFEADKDYVAQQVSVSDGRATTVQFMRVPLTTTQLESNLSERRAHWSSSDITVGFSATVNVQVEFQGLRERMYGTNYDESLYPTDCYLEVYVPEGFTQPSAWRSYRNYSYNMSGRIDHSFVPQSGTIDAIKDLTGVCILNSNIYMTAATSQWNAAERKLTVEWPHIDEGGKMNLTMVPTKSSTFMPEIYLCYTLGGTPHREILQTNQLNVSRSTISVSELIVTPRFMVSGKGMYFDETAGSSMAAGSRNNAAATAGAGAMVGHGFDPANYQHFEVTVMDGNSEIGKATINASGEWSTYCTLPVANALSRHSIWAKIAYKNGVSYQTEAKEVVYDPNGVVPLSVKMSFFNHHPQHLQNTEVMFDLHTREATPRSYGYDNTEGYDTDFTFEINLSTNDTTKVYAVDLAIFTKGPDAESFIIPAHYNKRKNRWIAYHKFNTRSLPYNVNVRPYYHRDIIASRQEAESAFSYYHNALTSDANVVQMQSQADALLAQLQAAVTAGDGAAAETLDRQLMAVYNEMFNYCGMPVDNIDVDESQETAINQEIEEILKQKAYFEQAISENLTELNQLGNFTEGITTQPATGLTEQSLKADGYENCLMDDGSKLFIRTNDDGSMNVVSLKDNLMVTYNPQAAARTNAMKAEGGGLEALKAGIAEFWSKVSKLNEIVSEISNYADMALNVLNNYLKDLCTKQNEIINLINKTSAVDPKKMSWLEKAAMNVTRYARLKSIAAKSTLASKARNVFQHFKVGDGFGTIGGLISLVNNFREMGAKIEQCEKIYDNIPVYCPDDQFKADQLRADALSLGHWAVGYALTKIASDITSITGSVAGLLGCTTIVAAPEGLIGVAASVALLGLTKIGDEYFQMRFDEEYCDIIVEKNTLQCYKKKKKNDDDDKDCNENCGDGGGSSGSDGMSGGTNGSTGLLDPSGFVYEGVESNRLEGVTTTVFYKANQNDAIATVWDAENYGQVNPQLTDENGEYGWMVPTGWWQVKYEKPGYQTEYSEWLPVPPPQLDVNQAMTQMTMPVVADVQATTQAVTVTFDKYMLADSLNARHIFITRGGQKLSGTIEPLLPADDAEAMRRIANRVRFVPTAALPANEQLTLTVKGTVQSYAGVEMGSDYQQEFDIQATVERIMADTAINVIYDQGYALTIQAIPAEAAAGKKVTARILSDMIASINSQISNLNAQITELTLDAQGKAVITITGEAHGTTALLLRMADNAEVEHVVEITVKEQGDFVCPMPVSNYQPGQAYPAGTQIELTCSMPGATILYTTDGSCPCSDTNDVHQYTGPITLMADMVIKAIARAPGYEESDIAEMEFFVESYVTPITYDLRVAERGYATFYDSQYAFQMPDGLRASIVSGISGGRLSYEQISGNIVPQATAVLIEAEQKYATYYTLTSTTTAPDATPTVTNLLHGSDDDTTVGYDMQDADAYLFYKLAYGPSGTSLADSFGWFWGAQQGAPFRIEGHHAWLAVPKTAGARAYLITGEETDVPIVVAQPQQTTQITDLQGRRLDNPTQPGVYIMDGRKVVVGARTE